MAKKYIFYELGKQSKEPVSEDLEEAAEKMFPVYWKNYPKDGIVRSESSYDTNKQCRGAFIAGAEWQKSKMPMPEDTVIFQKGIEEGKRLMMEDAVEGEIEWDNDIKELFVLIPLGGEFKEGQKVKIIIAKEDKE